MKPFGIELGVRISYLRKERKVVPSTHGSPRHGLELNQKLKSPAGVAGVQYSLSSKEGVLPQSHPTLWLNGRGGVSLERTLERFGHQYKLRAVPPPC